MVVTSILLLLTQFLNCQQLQSIHCCSNYILIRGPQNRHLPFITSKLGSHLTLMQGSSSDGL